MIRFITFSDSNMMRSAGKCLASAMAHGADAVQLFTKADVERWEVCKANPDVFRQPEDPRRAWSWWAFKPLIISHAMSQINDGQFLVYSDAGIEVIDNLKYITDRMDQDVWLFGNNWEHAHWCKADTVEAVWPLDVVAEFDKAGGPHVMDWHGPMWNRFSKQVQATVIAFRVSNHSRKFVKEWLTWCLFEGGRLIDDSPSRVSNHPEFQEHRHDQAILTTLAYREGIRLHYWPAVYNRGGDPEFVYEKLPEYAGDTYPVLLSHHRKRDYEWTAAA